MLLVWSFSSVGEFDFCQHKKFIHKFKKKKKQPNKAPLVPSCLRPASSRDSPQLCSGSTGGVWVPAGFCERTVEPLESGSVRHKTIKPSNVPKLLIVISNDENKRSDFSLTWRAASQTQSKINKYKRYFSVPSWDLHVLFVCWSFRWTPCVGNCSYLQTPDPAWTLPCVTQTSQQQTGYRIGASAVSHSHAEEKFCNEPRPSLAVKR